jgi:type IV pilus assembly protein PilC
MMTFDYIALDRDGRRLKGLVTAADEHEVETVLRRKGVWLLEVRPTRESRSTRNRVRSRPRRRDLIVFCTLMAFQTRVGIPMVQALDGVAQDGDSKAMAHCILELRRAVESGSTLAEAMTASGGVFPPDLVQLVRAGEQGGSLPEAFHQARHHFEWQERVSAEVQQATLYPLLVLLVTGLFVGVLFTFVVPKFAGLLEAVKVPLPAPTRWVFGISGFARESGWKLMAAVGACGVMVMGWRRRSLEFRCWLDRCRYRIPVVGPFTRLLVMTRFAHNLGLLYRNGLALPTALELVSGVVGSPWLAGIVRDVRARVLEGSTLSEALRPHPVFPALLIRLVVVGERTGQLDESLEQLAIHYQELLPRRLKRLLGLLEPALILGLVGVVGTVALAVILPVLTLMQSLR